MEYTAAIITALGIGGLLTKLVEYWIKKRETADNKEKSFTKIFNAVHTVYYSLMIMLRDSSAHRIIILKTTNGGGKPRLTGKLYGSILYEAFENPLGSKKEFWQRQQLDIPYMEMLYEMNKTGKLIIETEKMPKGMLYDVYVKDNIVESWLFKIAERENEFIYLSANFTKKQEKNSENRDLFRTGINRLINIFSDENIK